MALRSLPAGGQLDPDDQAAAVAGATIAVGALAGAYPAARAAKMSPTAALTTV